MKKFVLKDLIHDKEFALYLSNESTSLEDLWHSLWPKKLPYDEKYKPKVFDDIKEAKRYLKEVRRKFKKEWEENSHVLKIYGKRKYDWDIYEYNSDETL